MDLRNLISLNSIARLAKKLELSSLNIIFFGVQHSKMLYIPLRVNKSVNLRRDFDNQKK